jgi:hypothetical protein
LWGPERDFNWENEGVAREAELQRDNKVFIDSAREWLLWIAASDRGDSVKAACEDIRQNIPF